MRNTQYRDMPARQRLGGGTWGVGVFLCSVMLSSAAFAQAQVDENVLPRYVFGYGQKSVKSAGQEIQERFLTQPIHYPGSAKCKDNDVVAFYDALKRDFSAYLASNHGVSNRAMALDRSSRPALTREAALSWRQEILQDWSDADRKMANRTSSTRQVDYTFSCARMAQGTTPVPPADADWPASMKAPAKREPFGSIVLAGPPGDAAGGGGPAAAQQAAALEAAARRDALVAAERKRYGAGRDKEIGQLVDLRARIASKKPRMCKSNPTRDEIRFDDLSSTLVTRMTRERAEQLYAQMKNSATACGQSGPAKMGPLVCDRPSGVSTCTATRECAAMEYPCPSNAQ